MAELLLDKNAADPVLPGASFIFEAVRAATVEPNPGSTVFVPYTSDWGPDNTPIEWGSYSEALEDLGPSDTPGRRAVFGAFLGEGLPGKGGAGAVVGYRLALPAAAAAIKTLQNTTPATALTLTAKYKGTRASSHTFTVRAGSVGGTNELVVIEGGREAEVYAHTTTDIAGLAATINASSNLYTAVSNITGVALALVAASAITTPGNDGTAYTGTEYSAMFGKIEFVPFAVFAAYGLSDPTIIASLIQWKNDVATLGKRVRLVIGAATGETFATHKTRAQGYNDPDILAFGTGDISDVTLTADGSAVSLTTAQGVTRVAGAWARRGKMQDLVNVRFAGWTAVGGATRAQAKIAAVSGMTLLTRDGSRTAPTKIGLGVTSYSTTTAPQKPFTIYSNAKFIATMHELEMEITADQEGGDDDEIIDGRPVDPKNRDLVLGRAQSVVKKFIDLGALTPDSVVTFDPERPAQDTDTVVALLYYAEFRRGLRGIRNRIVVG